MYKDGDRVNVEIVGQAVIQSQTGTWSLALTFAHPEKGAITGNLWLTPACAGKLRGFYRTVGLDPDTTDVGMLDPGYPKYISLEGKPVSIVCKEEVYNDVPRVKVAFINPPIVPADSPDAKKFFATINAAVRAAKKVKPDEEKAPDADDPRF
jgi:hypothetical protein